MWEKIKEIFFGIWSAVLMLCIVILIFFKHIRGNNGGIYLIAFLAIWVGVPIVIVALQIKMENKRKKQYEEENITEMVIENKKLGKIILKKDKLERTLTSKEVENSFGNHNPKIFIENFDENNLESILENLEYLYSNQEKILNDFYKKIKGFCDEYKEKDLNGQEITEEYIKEYFHISGIDIKNEEEEFKIILWGGLGTQDIRRNLLEEQFIIAEMDCNTKSVIYYLEMVD